VWLTVDLKCDGHNARTAYGTPGALRFRFLLENAGADRTATEPYAFDKPAP